MLEVISQVWTHRIEDSQHAADLELHIQTTWGQNDKTLTPRFQLAVANAN